jgi:hypothetical protein
MGEWKKHEYVEEGMKYGGVEEVAQPIEFHLRCKHWVTATYARLNEGSKQRRRQLADVILHWGLLSGPHLLFNPSIREARSCQVTGLYSVLVPLLPLVFSHSAQCYVTIEENVPRHIYH